MGDIVLLDELTINKIAAGEVIERPASVIKEMVENSIDAGANKITVEIKNGGISFIRISDNGKGIKKDDMEIAFERHATSKIRQADDILKVKSMGFRGEALASIAAIARVEMVSRTADSNVGDKIVIEGGNILEQTEVGANIGTTITVTNLFYNTPVRYKFLKKDYTESGYIEDTITRLALVNKNIAFKLINNGKTVIQTNGNGDSKSIIYSIFGKDVAEAVLDVDYAFEGIKISGVVGKPEIARSNRTNQLFFVNSRYIKDRTLNAAAEQAFKGMIPINKFGFVILNIDISPELVDVNVHPAKLEVRFEDENKVFKAVYHAIKSGLAKGELIENVSKPKSDNNSWKLDQTTFVPSANVELKEDTKFELKKDEPKSENLLEEVYKFRQGLKKIGVGETSAPYTIDSIAKEEKKENEKNEEIEVKKEDIKIPTEEQVNKTTEELINQRDKNEEIMQNIEELKANNEIPFEENVNSNFDDMYKRIFGEHVNLNISKQNENISEENEKVLEDIKRVVIEKENEEKEKIQEKPEISDEVTKVEKPEINDEVIKVEKPEEYIVEQNEQIQEFKSMASKNYKFIGIAFSTYIIVEIDDSVYIIDQHAAHERIMYEKVKSNYYDDNNKDSQLMLLPDIISLSHKEAQLIKENLEMFENAGFTLEAFGENTLKLTGVPNICIDMNTKQLFLDLLDEVNNFQTTSRQEKEEKFIATIACKSAVKANMKLDEEEVSNLMDELLKLPNPFTCPHGRPTAIKMTKYDIERKFSRK